MRVTLFALAVAILFCGCSKKSLPGPDVAATVPDVPASTAPKQDNTAITAALDDLNRKVQQQQYDAAVGALVALSQMPKTDAQEAQFRARMRETELALNKKAVQGDPAAAQSAQMLGRMMTGR